MDTAVTTWERDVLYMDASELITRPQWTEPQWDDEYFILLYRQELMSHGH